MLLNEQTDELIHILMDGVLTDRLEHSWNILYTCILTKLDQYYSPAEDKWDMTSLVWQRHSDGKIDWQWCRNVGQLYLWTYTVVKH